MKENKILYGLTGIIALANCDTNKGGKNNESQNKKKVDDKKNNEEYLLDLNDYEKLYLRVKNKEKLSPNDEKKFIDLTKQFVSPKVENSSFKDVLNKYGKKIENFLKRHNKDIETAKVLEKQKNGEQLTKEEQEKLYDGLKKIEKENKNKKFEEPKKQYQEDKKEDKKLADKKTDYKTGNSDEETAYETDKEKDKKLADKKTDYKSEDSEEETADETDKEKDKKDDKKILYGRVGLKNEVNWCYQNAAWQMIMTMVLRDENFKKAITTESKLSELPKLIGEFINGYEKDELKNKTNKRDMNKLLDETRHFKDKEDKSNNAFTKHGQQDSSEYFISILNVLDICGITKNYIKLEMQEKRIFKTKYKCNECNQEQSNGESKTKEQKDYFQINISDINDKKNVTLSSLLSSEQKEEIHDLVDCPFCSEGNKNKITKVCKSYGTEVKNTYIKSSDIKNLKNITIRLSDESTIELKNLTLSEDTPFMQKYKREDGNFFEQLSIIKKEGTLEKVTHYEKSPIYELTKTYSDINLNKYLIISLNRTKAGAKDETLVNMPIEDNFNGKKYKMVYIGYHSGDLNGGHWYGYALGQQKDKDNKVQEKWIQCNDSTVSEETEESIKKVIPRSCYYLYERQD